MASGTFNHLYDPASGASIGSSWVGPPFPLASRDGRQVVAYVDRAGGVFDSQHLESLDPTDGSVLLEGATSNFPPASSQRTQTEAWISPSVLVASFQRFSLDAPIGWSTRHREFVLANSLQPFGSGTDGYFPANSTLIAGNGVLLVLDGESLTVMTVNETTN